MKEEIQAQEQIKGPDFAAPSATPLFQPTTENGNKPQDDPETHLTRVRRHCTLAGIKEAELLAWMGETGATDGSQATLDEVPAKVLEITVNNWSDIAAKVNVREGGNLL